MSSADLITCCCKNCHTLLCVSTNHWTEITSSYATYDVAVLFSHPGLEQLGPTRPGSKESELEGCTVQPLNCIKCKDSIGVKCVGVVPEKEIHRYVCLFHLCSAVVQVMDYTFLNILSTLAVVFFFPKKKRRWFNLNQKPSRKRSVPFS